MQLTTEQKLAAHKYIEEKAIDLSTRWVKSMPDSYGYSPTNIRIDHEQKKVFFGERHYDECSLIGGRYDNGSSIDFKYFEDDATLEADAKAYYVAKEKLRNEKFARMNELQNKIKNQEDSKELEKLRTELYGYNYFQPVFI